MISVASEGGFGDFGDFGGFAELVLMILVVSGGGVGDLWRDFR